MKNPTDAEGGLCFSEVAHAIQAAAAGQGVALLNRVLIADALARGVLVAPFGPVLEAPGWTLLQLAEHLVAALRPGPDRCAACGLGLGRRAGAAVPGLRPADGVGFAP